MLLNQEGLLHLLIDSIKESGWNVIVVKKTKPFELRIYRDDARAHTLHVFIWNCTHGGGRARAADEYRIQITGVVPQLSDDGISLLLGWHDGYGVFAAWDIRRHHGQDSSSPSAQIREELLAQANTKRIAVGVRGNNEVVAAFKPDFIVEYALSAKILHRDGISGRDIGLLNNVAAVNAVALTAIENHERRKVITTIVRHFRAADFRRRVLGAYNHQCAMCGIALKLIDAAHILPVAADGSTDNTNNGVALCKIHHAAFDSGLVSFDDNYRVEVSGAAVEKLKADRRLEGLREFKSLLKVGLVLPNDVRDYPLPDLVRRARKVRNWVS